MYDASRRFKCYFSDIVADSAPIKSFLELFLQVLCTIPVFYAKYWLLFHITIVETIDSADTGMNPVAVTIINPRKEFRPSRKLNQGPVTANG